MISLSDDLLAAGAPLTFHYTHPPRTVAMQISLAARLDFTSPSPDNFMRASVFFTGYVAAGEVVTLVDPVHGAPPQFRASAVAEVKGALLADNCDLVAVITQFDQAATAVPSDADTVTITTVAFAHRPGGPPIYTHVVKSWPGGRAVDEAEATATARTSAQGFAVDVSQALMTVTTRVGTG